MAIQNISLNREPVELRCGIKYIIIDALYINDVKQELSNLSSDNLINEVRIKVFPFTDTPFVEYTPKMKFFTINQIKKVEYDQIDFSKNNVLSTDSGVLIFINEIIFIDFVTKFDYGELVNSQTDLLNIFYWRSIVNNYNLLDIAIVVSPGVDFGVEFDGSGSYMIQ